MILRKARSDDYNRIEELYEESFPAEEKKAFALLLRQQEDVGLLVIEEKDCFCGFFSLILYKDIVAIDYFAISGNMRGKGYGSAALTFLREYYPEMRILLEIETPYEGAENIKQRLSRQGFYERNGFSLIGKRALVNTCDYTLMTCGGTVSMEEYYEIIKIMYDKENIESVVKEISI